MSETKMGLAVHELYRLSIDDPAYDGPLFAAIRESVTRQVRRRTSAKIRSRFSVDDLRQEVYVRLLGYRRRHGHDRSFETERQFWSFLNKLVEHTVIDQFRAGQRTPEFEDLDERLVVESDIESPLQSAHDSEIRRIVRNEIKVLDNGDETSAKLAQVIRMMLHSVPMSRAAKQVGIKPSTARFRYGKFVARVSLLLSRRESKVSESGG